MFIQGCLLCPANLLTELYPRDRPEARIPGTLKKGGWVEREGIINPLHPNISMHTLLTILDTFPNMLVRRICLTIKFLQLIIISFILMTLMFDSGVILKGESRC